MDKTEKNIIFEGAENADLSVLENRTYNIECPVCFEKENLVPLSCLHLIHLDCAKNLISPVCPICGAPLEDLPDEIQKQIQENEKKYQEELDEEDRRVLEEDLSRRRSLISRMEMVIQPPPNVEILAAMQYTRSMGIPLSCIPTEMKVNVPEGTPRPPPGTWFQMTVGHAIERAREILRNQEDNDETDDYEADETDETDEDVDEEDPFEDENKQMENNPRSLEFNDNSRRHRD
jgi:hypothetical protein